MATTGTSNGDHDPYEAYEDSEKTPDSNSVGPELTLKRANEHARRQQNSPPRAAPPVADHHCASTTTDRTPTSSTMETQRGSRAARKPCRRSPSEEPTTSEETLVNSKTMSSRRTRHERAVTAQSADLGFSPGAPCSTNTAPQPHHQRRAAHCGLQGGVFKKITARERRHRPIRGSWAFTRST
jgi:hypothetical protein